MENLQNYPALPGHDAAGRLPMQEPQKGPGARLPALLGQRGAARQHTHDWRMPGPGGNVTVPSGTRELRLSSREFQQLDRSKIAHVTANALGGVKQNMRLGAERVTQNPQIRALGDRVTGAKITKGDGG